MTDEQQGTAANSNQFVWNVEAFDRFWRNPDLNAVGFILTDDVAGYWPRASAPVRGRNAYVNSIAELLAIVPDFRGRALDHYGDDSRMFVQWEATATGPGGQTVIRGVDRIVLRDGLVVENRIFSDHPIFEALAARLGAM